MVRDKIEDDLKPPLMSGGDQPIEVGQSAEGAIGLAGIRNVVPHGLNGGPVARRSADGGMSANEKMSGPE